MEYHKCGCTGIRHCLLCSKEDKNFFLQSLECNIHWFCPGCNLVFKGSILSAVALNNSKFNWCSLHENHICSSQIDKVIVINNFITEGEESYLLQEIYKDTWKMSQSGRRKQDFGPKVNFKQKKVKLGMFTGFPGYSKFIVEKLKNVEVLKDFLPVELCNLEYSPDRGSSIDPHIDDTWVWGEQLVTLNLNSAAILTLSNNLTSSLISQEIQIPMISRSLVIIEKEARYKWMHGIRAKDIVDLRVAMTFRNLSSSFLSYEIGQQIIDIAKSFQGKVVN